MIDETVLYRIYIQAQSGAGSFETLDQLQAGENARLCCEAILENIADSPLWRLLAEKWSDPAWDREPVLDEDYVTHFRDFAVRHVQHIAGDFNIGGNCPLTVTAKAGYIPIMETAHHIMSGDEIRQALVSRAQRFAIENKTSLSAISLAATNDSKFLARVRDGEGFNIKTYDRVVAWLDAAEATATEEPAQ